MNPNRIHVHPVTAIIMRHGSEFFIAQASTVEAACCGFHVQQEFLTHKVTQNVLLEAF